MSCSHVASGMFALTLAASACGSLAPAAPQAPREHRDDTGAREGDGVGAQQGDDIGAPEVDGEAARLPGEPGPYAVGVRSVQLQDPERDRTFLVDVWYPVDPATPDGTDNVYEIEMGALGTVAHIESPARRDATAMAPAGAGWPLVVFSHGYGGVRFQSPFITEHLASHGIIVASPDHPGNTLSDVAELGNDDAAVQSAIDRPLDVALVLDGMLTDALGTGLVVDATRVGATGHSFGAWTALEVARRDARIGSVFPMAPGFRQGATADFVAQLARPLLFIGGSADDTCEFDENQLLPYEMAETPKYLLEVMGAGHLDFSNLCQVAIARLFVDDGCDPESIDPAVVHARVRAVATAFALRYVAGDSSYQSLLTPDAVTALGDVAYWSAP